MQPENENKTQLRVSIENIQPLGNECWDAIEPFNYIKELDKNEYYSKEGQLTKDLGF